MGRKGVCEFTNIYVKIFSRYFPLPEGQLWTTILSIFETFMGKNRLQAT